MVDPRKPSGGLLVLTLVLFAASMLHTSVGIFQENQAVQAPLVALLNDPLLFLGDPFAEALIQYPSILWHVVAALARIIPLGPLLLTLFLIERLLGLYAAGRLARAFAPGSTLAPVGAMALFAFAIRPLLGAGTLVEFYFEHTGTAVVFLLLAGAAFYERRPLHWAVWMGLAVNATGLYGAYALAYFGAVSLCDRDYRVQWRRWIAACALIALIAVPSVVLALRALGHPLQDRALWLAASYARSWRHMYPGAWSLRDFLEAAGLLGMLCVFLVLGGKDIAKLRRHALVWSGVAASWLGLAFLAESVLSPALLVLQSARGTDIWVCFAALAIVAIGARAVERVTEDLGGSAGTRENGAAVVNDPERDRVAGAKDALMRRLPVALFFASFMFWRPSGWHIAAALLLILLVWPWLWSVAAGRGTSLRVAWLLALWVCAASAFEYRQRLGTDGRFSHPSAALDALVVRPYPSIAAIASWAKEHTPRDAVFLLDPGDPEWEPFRALSERSIYTSWEEGTAINWSPNFVIEWARRLRLLGYDIRSGPPRTYRTLGNLYAGLTDGDLSRIRMEVPFRYWIVPSGQPSGLLEVFRSEDFKVLDLEGEILLP